MKTRQRPRFSSTLRRFYFFFFFFSIVHNNRLVSHLHGRGDNRKGGNLCIDDTFILFVPRGVDLYQSDERGSLCLEKPRRDLRKRVALKEGSRSRWTETPPGIPPSMLSYVCITLSNTLHTQPCYIVIDYIPTGIFGYLFLAKEWNFLEISPWENQRDEIWLLFVERNLSLKQKKIFKFFFFQIKQIYLDSNFVQFILQKVRNEAIFLVFRFFVLQSKVSARKKFKIEIPAEEEIKIQTKTLHSFNPIKWILPRINNRKNHTFETLVIIMPILPSLHLTKSQWN